MATIKARKTIAIVQGHPDPAGHRFCHALADAYAEGAAEGGHIVHRVEIARLDFPLLRTKADFEGGVLPPGLSEAWQGISDADHLVFVFPLWLGTMPALLKAFLEQIARPGYAFEYVKDGFPRKLLDGKSARLVVTMGMPTFVYRFWFLAHGMRALERNILKFVGIKPIRESFFGMIEAASDDKRKGWLGEIRRAGERGL